MDSARLYNVTTIHAVALQVSRAETAPRKRSTFVTQTRANMARARRMTMDRPVLVTLIMKAYYATQKSTTAAM